MGLGTSYCFRHGMIMRECLQPWQLDAPSTRHVQRAERRSLSHPECALRISDALDSTLLDALTDDSGCALIVVWREYLVPGLQDTCWGSWKFALHDLLRCA